MANAQKNSLSWSATALAVIAFVSPFVFPNTVHAQSQAELDRKTMSAYLRTDILFLIHKSGTIGHTDFGSESSITAGTWTGKNKRLGLGIISRNNRTNYSQVDASMSGAWTDFFLTYRLWWFQPYFSAGSCYVNASKNGVSLVNGICTTMGGGLDTRVPIGNYVVLNVETVFSEVVHYRDHADINNKMGGRRDFSIGAAISPGLTWMNILVGYRYRTYKLTTADGGKREIETGPHAGLIFGYDL